MDMLCRSVWGIQSCVLCLGAVQESCAHEEMRSRVPQSEAARAPAGPAAPGPGERPPCPGWTQ